MSVNDAIADMLTRIRNAVAAGQDTVVMPASRMKTAIAKIMKDEGFIKDYELVRGGVRRTLKIYLRYTDGKEPTIKGVQRVSKPGLRIYVRDSEIPRVYGGIGIAILSTTKGLMTGQEARRNSLGGEVICYVW
ncbi:MAG: 30S ribosomal protein S8 [Chloroflexi bacterium]|nr:30S ribosomal protein S8 [Chloroflexota bacterium]